MRASRARRRWLKWCRYVDKTQTRRARSGVHYGQASAYVDVMYARRWSPKGVREPWHPKWGMAR